MAATRVAGASLRMEGVNNGTVGTNEYGGLRLGPEVSTLQIVSNKLLWSSLLESRLSRRRELSVKFSQSLLDEWGSSK